MLESEELTGQIAYYGVVLNKAQSNAFWWICVLHLINFSIYEQALTLMPSNE